MGGMPRIPVSKIIDYGRFLGLDQIEIEWLVKIIMAVDAFHCGVESEKAKKRKPRE